MADLLRGPVTTANLTAAAGVTTTVDGWWPCLDITWRTPVPASITKITAQVRERGTTSPVAETVMTADELAAGAAKIVNGVSVGQHLEVRLSPAGAPGLPFQPTPWLEVTTSWDALMAELDGLSLGCFKFYCGNGVPTRTDVPMPSFYVREDISQLWRFVQCKTLISTHAVNIEGNDLDDPTNVVEITGIDPANYVRLSKPRASVSDGALTWDAYSRFPDDSQNSGLTWFNDVELYGVDGADVLLFSHYNASPTSGVATADEAFDALAAVLPFIGTGYDTYKVVGLDDTILLNRDGLSVLVEEFEPGWVLMSDLTEIRLNGVTVTSSARSIDITGTGVAVSVDGEGNVTADFTGGASGTDLGWFNVMDYGALGDGVTDDTVATQAAIDACEAAGGGTVYFPRGVYIVGGALQDTSRSNAQLLLPRRDYVDAEAITIVLRGEAPPPAVFSVIGATPLPDTLSVIKGTLNTGSGSLIGCHGPSGTAGDFSNVYVAFRDLTVQMPANPALTAIDCSRVAELDADNLLINAGNFDVSTIAAQSTSTSYGLRVPGRDNGALTRLGVVTVVGFYKGYEIGEHCVGQDVSAGACRQAFVFIAAYHASHFDRLMTVHCQRGLVFTGEHHFDIDQFNIEHAPSGTWVQVYDIDDASNYGHGPLRWHVVLGGTGIDSTFTVNGASNVAYRKLDKNIITSPTTGALAKFNDAYSLTAGNLSGDVTTSDSLVTTLANSGVSAGTYSYATVTVDAKGRVTSASSGSAAAYMPLVTGEQPPVLVNDGAGRLIAVAYSP